MTIPYYHVDAFSGEAFSGNPAGVCILPEWLPDALMQSMAAEHNLSETAFLVEEESGWSIRWMTPLAEVDLCGHATLAAAHVLFRHREWTAPGITFQSRSGPLKVTRHGNLLTLDFPATPAVACEIPDGLIQGLGIGPLEVWKSADYLVLLESEAAVRALGPDPEVAHGCGHEGRV